MDVFCYIKPHATNSMEVPNILGLKFSPSASELLIYLKQRILSYFVDPNYSMNGHVIPDIELPNWEPEELPGQYNRLSALRTNGREWFFFCSRKERTVLNVGYWKITSSDKKVKCDNTGEEMGNKKTLTFYQRRSSTGKLTHWGMHEYHLNPSYLGYGIDEMPFVVCCVFKRSSKKDDDDYDGTAFHEGVLSDNSTPESQTPTNQSASTIWATNLSDSTIPEEEGESLPQIQQLPTVQYPDGISPVEGPIMSYHYADGVGPSLEGFFDGNSFNNYWQYQDGGDSFYC